MDTTTPPADPSITDTTPLPDPEPASRQFDVQTDLGLRLVAVSGELDMATGPLLRSSVDEVLQQPGDITVDLAGLTFIDSGGFAALVQIGNALDSSSRLRVTHTSPRIRNVFVTTGLGRWID